MISECIGLCASAFHPSKRQKVGLKIVTEIEKYFIGFTKWMDQIDAAQLRASKKIVKYLKFDDSIGIGWL